jgi:DNA-3-methyladenine glycosylase I
VDRTRCAWAAPEAMWAYHDREWGVPVHDDRKHFEFLILEGAQAGLSWSTILNKRDGYRRAFADFDPEKVECAVGNARAFLQVQADHGSFDKLIWSFVGGKPIVNHWKRTAQLPARTKESDALAAELARRGFKFAGSTIMYAHMQACGLVNDHLVDCWRYRAVNGRGR